MNNLFLVHKKSYMKFMDTFAQMAPDHKNSELSFTTF